MFSKSDKVRSSNAKVGNNGNITFNFIFACTCAFIPSYVALGTNDPTLDLIDVPSVSGEAQTFYGLSISGIPVGIAATAIKDEKIGATELDMRILMRSGGTPLVMQLQSELFEEKNIKTIKMKSSYAYRKEVFGNTEWSWTFDSDKMIAQGKPVSLGSLLTGTQTAENYQTITRTPNTFFFPFQPKNTSQDKSLFSTPFSGDVFSISALNAKFDTEPMPTSFSFPMSDGVRIEFSRKEKSLAKNYIDEIRSNNIDPAWFSSERSLESDIRNLQKSVKEGADFIESTEREIKRKTPGIPYLLHRKLVNYSSLCKRVLDTLATQESHRTSNDHLFGEIAQDFLLIQKEAQRELPSTLAVSPELAIFGKPPLQWQYIRAANHIVRKTHSEVASLLAVDQERKTNLELTISAIKQERKAVLRANLRAKKSTLRVSLETVSENNKEASNAKKNPSLVDGKFFVLATNPEVILESICQKEQGSITVDLADRENFIVRSDLARGIWDESTRNKILAEFLNRVAAVSNCTHISARVPARMEREARSTIEIFRHDVVQTENEFQVSNGKTTRLKTFPGVYELTLTSFVTGKLIGKQEINVEEKDKSKLNLSFK